MILRSTDNAWSGPERNAVFAVVVTFNPDVGLLKRLNSIRGQVANLLVIDNASHNVDFVEASASAANCTLLLNCHNLGVATALNQAAERAVACGANWLATFDQDSALPADAIPRLIDAYLSLPRPDRVAVLAMSHRDRGTGRDYHRPGEILFESEHWRQVRTTITSGSLINLSVFHEVGPFDERLFIDMVDLEYCLRCRRAGFRIVEHRSLTLAHSIGDSTIRRVLGRPITLTRHSPVRRYYITRNQLEVSLRYVGFDPRWAMGAVLNLIGASAATLAFESNAAAKFSAMLAGFRDFVLRRFGKRR